jgi:hypothetical protein
MLDALFELGRGNLRATELDYAAATGLRHRLRPARRRRPQGSLIRGVSPLTTTARSSFSAWNSGA